MKQEILKIIEMNKKGKISDDQMAELFEILTGKNKFDISKKDDSVSLADESVEPINHFTETSTASEINKKMKPRDRNRNRIIKSHFIKPVGNDFIFQNNSIRLSHFSGTEFKDEAEFINNSIHASHFTRIKMKGGSVYNCYFNKSNLDSIKIGGATLTDTKFKILKISNLEMTNESKICNAKFSRGQVKGMILGKSSLLQDIDFHRLNFANVNFVKTEILNSAFHRVNFSNLIFNNVKFNNCKFHRCNFKDAEISNIDLRDYEFSNINFSKQRIDGNDALCSFTGNPKIFDNHISSDEND